MTGSLQPPFVPAQWYPPDPPKSAVAAGLLQLFFGWFGLGRFYVGSLGSIHATGPGHPGYRHRLLHRRFLHPRSAEHLDIHRRDPDVLGQREGQRGAQTPMMSPRAFLGVIGAFTLIGALVWLWSPITREDTDVAGNTVVCGDVSSSTVAMPRWPISETSWGATSPASAACTPTGPTSPSAEKPSACVKPGPFPWPSSAVRCCSAPCSCVRATPDRPAENSLHLPQDAGWRDHRLEPCPATRPTNPVRKALQWYDPMRAPLRSPAACRERRGP